MLWRIALVFVVFVGLITLEILRLYRSPQRADITQPMWLVDEETEPDEATRAAPDEVSDAYWFRDVTDQSGVDFQHAVGPLGTYFMPEINGTGGALLDYNGDGLLDLFLVNSGRSPQAVGDFPEGTRTENRLFRQEADGTFTDVTAESGLGGFRADGSTDYGIGCAVGDINNNGHPDIYVTNYGPDRLYRNNGDGTFTDITVEAGIENPEWGTCAAFFDFDRDGWLDLVVINYTEDPIHGHSVACGFSQRKVSYCGPHKFKPTVDRLFRNEGLQEDEHGHTVIRFREVTDSSGFSRAMTSGFGVICADFDGDHWPDVFVANDMQPNRLWINQRDGTFREEAARRGVAVSGYGLAQGCMGVAWADLDGDGHFDLVITNLSTESSVFYRNDGHGFFSDATRSSLLAVPTQRHTGWGIAALDLENNGRLDLAQVNGGVVPFGGMFPPHGVDKFIPGTYTIENVEAYWREYADENILLTQHEPGRFQDVRRRGGDFERAVGSARALICGDIHNDGGIDLVVTYVGGRARIFRNEVPRQGHWLMVRCHDPRYQRDAYGAVVSLRCGDQWQTRLVQPSSSYLASHDPRVHFGLGDNDEFDEATVRWPDGLLERFPGQRANFHLVLRRGEGQAILESDS